MKIVTETPTKTKTKTESIATRVALHPFLAGMNRTELALLTDCAMATHFKPGQIIFHEGEPANRFYLLESGNVVLESGEGFGEPVVVVETIGAGDLLGWSWMFPPYVWHFTARAVEPTEAIFFYGTILREWERDPSLGYQLYKRMAPVMLRRLQAARKKMLALHHGTGSLEPVVLESPFMDQELDTDDGDNDLKKKD